MPFGRISVGNHQCQKMIYVSNVIFNQHYFSIQAITAALNGIPHVYVELLPLAQVQRMGSGSDSIWGQKKLLEPVCCMSNIFSVFHSSSTDSTCRQKKRLEPLLHVKYFQFSTVAVQIQLAGKNFWNLFVACQIYFQFSTVAVQIQLAGKKTVGTCLLHVKYFQFSTVAVQIQLGGKKKRLEPLLHVKYFQFSTVAVQIQLAGKKLLEPVCCMSNIFSFP